MGAPETRIKVVAEVDAAIKSFQTLTNSVAKTRESLTQKITAGTTTPFLTQGSLAANEAVAALQKYAEQMRTMQGSVAKSFGLTGKEAGLALKNEFAANAKGILDNVESIYGTAARDSVVKQLKEIGKQGGESYISELSKQLSTSKEVFQTSLDRIAQGAGSLGDKLSKVFDPLMNKLKQAGIAIAGLGAALGTFSFSESKDIEESMSSIARGTGEVGERLDSLKQSFRDVAGETDKAFSETASVIGTLNTNLGMSGTAIEATSQAILRMSSMTKESSATLAQGLTVVMKNWSLSADQAVSVADRLFKAWQSTSIPVATLMQQLADFGPVLRQMGYSFNDSTALLGKFYQEGVSVGDVLVALKKSIGEFSKAGVGDLGKEFEILSVRIKSASSESEAMRIAIASLGAKAGPALARSIREGRLELGNLVKVLQNASGAIAETYNRTQTLGEAMGELRNSAGFALEPFGDEMLSGAKQLTELTKTFSEWSREVGLGQKAAEAFFGALGVSLPKVEEFKNSLKSIKVEDLVSKFQAAGETLKKVKTAFTELANMVPWDFLLKNASELVLIIVGGWAGSKILAAVEGITRVQTAMRTLFAVISAHPAGAILTLIAALLELSRLTEGETEAFKAWKKEIKEMSEESVRASIALKKLALAKEQSKSGGYTGGASSEATRLAYEISMLESSGSVLKDIFDEALIPTGEKLKELARLTKSFDDAMIAMGDTLQATSKSADLAFSTKISDAISKIKAETDTLLEGFKDLKTESDTLAQRLGLSAKDAGEALKDELTKKITEARSTIEQQFGASAGDMFVRNLALMGARGGNALVAEIANSLAKIKDPLISVRTSFDEVMTGLVDSYQDLGVKSAATMKLFGASVKEAGAMFQTEMRDKILSAASQIEKAFGPAAAKQFWKMLSSMKSALGDFARSLQKELNTSSAMTKQIEDLKKFGEVTKTVLWETEKEMQVQYSNGITSITEVVQKATSGSAETMQSAEAAIQAFAQKIQSSGDAMAAGAQKGLDAYAQIPDTLTRINSAMGTLQAGSDTASTAMHTMATSMLASFGGLSEQIAATMNKAMNALLSELEKRISAAITVLKGQMDSLVPAARQAGADAGDAYATAFLAKVKVAYAQANASAPAIKQTGGSGDATADINAAARDVQYGF